MFARLALTLALIAPSFALAEPARLGVGVVATPQYEGSTDYSYRPAPNFAFSVGNVRLQSNGPGIEADVVSQRGFDAGPVLRYNFGRDPGSIDNAQVKALPKVDGAVELGGFAALSYPVGEGTFVTTRAQVVHSVGGGHNGATAELSLGVFRLAGDWRYGASAAATYATDNYMNAFFSVAPASPSGLAAFNPNDGFKDIGVRAFASYSVNDSWSVTGFAGVSQLIGDAANSPIVSVTGSSTQAVFGLGVSYTFN